MNCNIENDVVRHSEFILSNGLKVHLNHSDNSNEINVYLGIHYGSFDENDKTSGIAHVLEHLIFQATKKYDYDESKLYNFLDKYGLFLNAYTANDTTVYTISGYYETLNVILEFLYEQILNFEITDSDFSREKKIVIDELQDQSQPYHIAYYNNLKKLIGDERYCRAVGGDPHLVENFTKKQVMREFNKYYVPNNMILSIGGKIPSNIKKLINETFGNLKSGKEKNHRLKPITDRLYENFRYEIEILEVETVSPEMSYIELNWLLPNRFDLRDEIVELLMNYLTASMSSKFFMEFRVKTGLNYEGFGITNQGTDKYCVLRISETVQRNLLPDICEVLVKVINELMTDGIPKEDLEKWKHNLCFNFKKSYPVMKLIADLYANGFVQNPDNDQDYLNKIMKLEYDEVKDYIRWMFEGSFMICICNNYKGKSDDYLENDKEKINEIFRFVK